MPWFSPKLPVHEEDRQWVNDGFGRLEKLLGRRRLLEAKVVEPTAEDFPDPYDRTQESVDSVFRRVCNYMQVERSGITLEIFPDETEGLRDILPSWRSDGGTRAAGLYVHAHERTSASEENSEMVVAIRGSMLRDTMSLVATMAHALGHVILLGGNLLTHDTSDHEPMTDLLTVFLGLGIFTANSAARFKQFQDERRAEWSTQRRILAGARFRLRPCQVRVGTRRAQTRVGSTPIHERAIRFLAIAAVVGAESGLCPSRETYPIDSAKPGGTQPIESPAELRSADSRGRLSPHTPPTAERSLTAPRILE